MLLSHSGEYPYECKHVIFAANSKKLYDWPGNLLKQVRPYKWLLMLANFLRIIANVLRSLRLLNNQFADFFMNTLRLFRIFTNAHANACERLNIRMKRLHNACAAKHLANVSLCHFIRQAILNNRFALFVMDSQAFATFCLHCIWMNASKSLRMSYDHYTCLAINKNILRLLTKMLRKQ